MTGVPSSVPPVLTAAGLVIRATSSNDLVAFTPKTPTQWVALWRMHPGGTVLSAAAFGDVVVATTSQRQVVAYSAAGVRLWQHDLDELAFRPPGSPRRRRGRSGRQRRDGAGAGSPYRRRALAAGRRRRGHDGPGR